MGILFWLIVVVSFILQHVDARLDLEETHLSKSEIACARNQLNENAFKEYPYIVALGWKSNNSNAFSFLCDGVLISHTFVLTAAHCALTETILRKDLPSVRLGGGGNLTNANATDINIKEILVHPEYKLKIYNDIALAKLKQEAPYAPACLWRQHNLQQNKVTAIGYGCTEFGEVRSDALFTTSLQIVSNDDCTSLYQNFLPAGMINSQFCIVKPVEEHDSCRGDSGGPLFTNVTNNIHNSSLYVVGLPVFGRVQTRVSTYINWIEEIVWPEEF